ncbi:MAG: T9SS type A sorting domain-containing protein [Bacteroidetes bacterium]|nr:T9SS type A sorting domain-containing protein [Bacteroidota bacterium]
MFIYRFQFCETILSINNQQENPFIIYPNPTTSHLFLKNVKQSQMLFIYDLIGRQIFSHYLKREDSILNISNLPAGNYFIKMENPKFKSIIFQKL